ncbi:SOS response-associated peptidase [Halobacillus sp. Marseille-Q1614]|uniref:SOS response-associated peptidase n=1 Tax=Halobacillus sp. Marseille-Q1614 TaxID=2709134 RepID=UPI00156FBE6D|nr:SOS response-associated peptidase [Halobacillus sp. Marseille-Q1614]
MCGRFTLTAPKEDILRYFNIDDLPVDFVPRFNIAPGQKIWAIIHDGENKRAGQLDWGLIPPWAKDPKIGYKMINARSETAHEKPSFKGSMSKKRCLIIADSFYEWKKEEGKKQPVRILPQKRKLFAFAGLWEKWKSGEEERFTCTILTKEADEFMSSIHDRMPVILPKSLEDEWIKPVKWAAGEAHQFIEQLSIDDLEAYPVSTVVNSAKNETEECIKRLA